MKTTLLALVAFMSILPLLYGQQKPCNNYACVIEKVERLMKQTQKDYKALLDNLDSAEGYPDSKPEQIRALRRRVFVAIEGEKEAAKKAKKEAEEQRNEALRLKDIAEVEKKRADSAVTLVEITLDLIYFYDNKFGLAYDKNKGMFGFIDRERNVKIDFKYEDALPFDYTGFAKVKKEDDYYLIDTNGMEYNLATEVNQLDSTITALDLSRKYLEEIPPSVFQNKQLRVLLLSRNKFRNLPTEFQKLINLTSLDLSQNGLNSLPVEFGKLTKLKSLYLYINRLNSLPAEFGELINLTSLDMSFNLFSSLPVELGKLNNLKELDFTENSIPKEEQEKIKKLLPNCKIYFD